MIRLPFVDPGDVIEAVEASGATVSQGGVLLLPTESFYGLGADPWSEVGVERVFSLKARPGELGLPVLCADWQQVESLVVVPGSFRVKLARLWPAALTVVLPIVDEIRHLRRCALIHFRHDMRIDIQSCGDIGVT